MPARKNLPTVGRRRLAMELLQLRGTITREQVSAHTGISTGALFKIEKAQTRPQRRTLLQLLDFYQVEDQRRRQDLLDLLRRSDETHWLQRFEDNLPRSLQHLISFEADAVQISVYEGSFVPGLLQTQAYAEALSRALLPGATESDIDDRVEVRLRRQAVLAAVPAPKLWAVLDEAVVRRVVGDPAVHRDQLRRLLQASRSPNIILQIIPFDAGAHTGMPGQFTIMDYVEPDPPMVYAESAAGGLFMEAERDVVRYRENFRQLTAQAGSVEQTTRMIEDAAKAA
ncbi:helix-turn-helix transcriptional regulator [Actinoplanes sp. NBRC 103695]|uniref:helix-turn-helix domain-containing protein n=1 Tax=Actinoplanes sp. NBRC 103695 TaxID=3032202 RepID=UPI0024A4BAA2|nr:helix-turn-helix transcriptional regulator [Actinoplanes sp. NBRC 103695]GLY95731.1 transcriptional regulator [Actinoplanes sp. NBRC 103695]